MTNLVFDLSALFYRSLYNVNGYGSKPYTFDSQIELDQLMRKCAIDISFIIRQANCSRIIFALDSRSWRKDISIDENDGYKANRDKSKFINWENVFNTMKEFGEILESNGFIVSKIEKAEADDLICLWANELLYNQKQHVMIVASDEDIRQLVMSTNHDGNKFFSVVFNPFIQGKSTKKLYVPDGFNEWLNTDETVSSIFDRSLDIDKEDFIRLRDKEKITIETIDGNSIAINKVLCGDDGDNVPAIYTWLSKTQKGDDVTVRITNSKANKIIEATNAKTYKDLLDKKDIVEQQITKIAGHTPSFKIKDRIERQIKLVVLDKTVFPEHILNTFNDELTKQLSKPNINAQNWNMNSILEGTKYVKNSGNESNIFKQIDRLNTLF